MAENTLGRRIIDKQFTDVTIFDEVVQKKCEIEYINAYSGHADCNDLDSYIAKIPGVQKLFFVHGEEKGMMAIAKRTMAARQLEINLPERERVYELN